MDCTVLHRVHGGMNCTFEQANPVPSKIVPVWGALRIRGAGVAGGMVPEFAVSFLGEFQHRTEKNQICGSLAHFVYSEC